jgi:hypothetical protein
MPGVKRLIAKQTLLADTGSVTVSNLPQTYADLRLLVSARTNRASDTDAVLVRFNGDTGANYSTRLLEGSGTAASSRSFTSQTGLYLGQSSTGATATASTFGNSEATIPNYAGSTQKSVLSRCVSENNATTVWMSVDASLWTGTAAITSVSLAPLNGTLFIAGSTFYLYAITQVPVIVGGVETISGGYKVHTFTSTSSLRVIEGGEVEYLVVAGGGGGGTTSTGGGPTGGGGAGGLLFGRAGVAVGTGAVTVGGGGNANASGSASSVFSLSATGGGAGGDKAGSGGGSGGGGGTPGSAEGFNGTVAAGSGTSGQGNNGGTGSGGFGQGGWAGGGGGAGGAGVAGTISVRGDGGAGRLIFGTLYAGGGGGGRNNNGPASSGGTGGGGNGALSTTTPATLGVANTGGGGGGAGGNGDSSQKAGGSGIVIIRYPHIGN